VPKPIQVGSVTQALQRAFGFKGRYTPLLDEVIVPVYVIADPSPAQVTRLCVGSAAGTDNASNLPFVQLFNPPGSGVLVNLTDAVAIADIKTRIIVNLLDDPGDQLALSFFRDTRNRGFPTAELRTDNLSAVNLGNIIAILEVDGALAQTASWASNAGDPRQPLMVLKPGRGVSFQTELPLASAEEIRVNLRWLEVPIWNIGPESGLP